MRVGGPARFFSAVMTLETLKDAVRFGKQRELPIFILGDGSNIIVGDKGFHGLVIKPNLRGITFADHGACETLVTVSAGENWDEFVGRTVAKDLYGLENLSFIPGTVGAAPIQNIGAYGIEIRETIAWVEVFDMKTMKIKKLINKECAFGYRESIFKKKENKNLIIYLGHR